MKARRRLLALLCLLAMLSAMAGCGEKKAEEPETPAQTGQPAQPETAPETPAEPARPAVRSNGGQFVRVDGNVWFRRYDAGALDEPRLWGDFLKAWPSHEVKSTLCYYDVSSGAVTEAMPDDGFGELWFGVDGFYLSRVKDGGQEAYFKTLDGAETVLGDGSVLGVSENGLYAAIRGMDGIISVYRGMEKIGGSGMDNGILDFCALTDDGTLLGYAYDYENAEGRLLRADAGTEGAAASLGTLPALPEGSGAYAWELEQCLVDGNDVWCTFGAYEGTGHFLADALCVRAKLDTENSLETVEDQPTAEYPFVPKLWHAVGEIVRSEHKPGEAEIDADTGSLIVYDETGDASVLVPGFLPQNDYSDDRMIEQALESVDDAVYAIVADARRDEANDVGWRYAYRPGALHYLRVSMDGEVTVLDGGAWNTVPNPEELYKSFRSTWSLYATDG